MYVFSCTCMMSVCFVMSVGTTTCTYPNEFVGNPSYILLVLLSMRHFNMNSFLTYSSCTCIRLFLILKCYDSSLWIYAWCLHMNEFEGNFKMNTGMIYNVLCLMFAYEWVWGEFQNEHGHDIQCIMPDVCIWMSLRGISKWTQAWYTMYYAWCLHMNEFEGNFKMNTGMIYNVLCLMFAYEWVWGEFGIEHRRELSHHIYWRLRIM